MKKIIFGILFAIGLAIGIAFAICEQPASKLTILHTNDTHSQVEPTDPNAHNGNLGGYVRRMEMVNQIRKNENVLLVDAGDFSQGTPYFNLYKGAVEIEAMNRMGYDAITLGNHEFDNPVDSLAKYLSNVQFAVVVSNYDVQNTALKNIVKPYHIVDKDGIKIGIVGTGISLEGLVSKANIEGVIYSNPIEAANKYAALLKTQEECDIVICLSHMGYKYNDSSKPSDVMLAANSKDIDVIIGGHTHSLVEGEVINNLDNEPVIISQMGKSGMQVGKLEIELD